MYLMKLWKLNIKWSSITISQILILKDLKLLIILIYKFQFVIYMMMIKLIGNNKTMIVVILIF